MAEGLHEAIIDLDLWEGARARREETGVKWVKTHSLEHEHILTGLLKCPICGVGMSGTYADEKIKEPANIRMISITDAGIAEKSMRVTSVIAVWY